MIKRISLHPYIAAFFELVAGLFFGWWLLNVTAFSAVILWAVVRFFVTIALVALVYCPPPLKRMSLFFSLFLAQFGFALTILLLDFKLMTVIATVGISILCAMVYGLMPANIPGLSFAFKPARRARLMLTMVGIFGLWVGLFALSTLQIVDGIQFFILWVLWVVSQSVVALWWWMEYGIKLNRKTFTNYGALVLLLLQISGFVWWWPVGYLSAGFFMLWIWYILWLMLRFNLTEEGIIFKKQLPFLVFNALAMFAYIIFVVRWK